MGPNTSSPCFAASRTIIETTSGSNLLKPYTIEIRANNAKQVWDVDGLHLEVVLAGGSREDCESWFVTLKRTETTTSALILVGSSARSPSGTNRRDRTTYGPPLATASSGNRRKRPIFRPVLIESRPESGLYFKDCWYTYILP